MRVSYGEHVHRDQSFCEDVMHRWFFVPWTLILTHLTVNLDMHLGVLDTKADEQQTLQFGRISYGWI